MTAPNGAVPVEALLKLSLDQGGAQRIEDFLQRQEKSFGRLEGFASRISDHFGGLTRGAAGLVGIAGVGAIVKNFIDTSQAGGLVGLAAGHATGGRDVWHPYGQAMLSAQGATGVAAGDISQGLIMAVQMTGGSPSPAQAAVLGGLLAGYGQTVGMSPSQVAAVVAPILQASNKTLTPGNLLGTLGGLSGGLSNFPGSQQGPMLQLLSQLGVAQALGVGPAGGFTPNMGGLTAIVNSAAGANSIFRNAGVTGSAISSVSGGLQNAFGNPAMEAFLQMAGVSYWDQRKGLTPQNMTSIMSQATKEYGTGITRDLALRSMFGLQGADLLETFAPGSKASKALSWAMQHPHDHNAQQLLNTIHHAQLGTTPGADLQKIQGNILRMIEQNPVLAAAAGIGLYKGRGLLGKGLKAGAKGLGRLFGRGSGGAGSALADAWGEADGSVGAGLDAGAGDAAGSALADVLGAGALKLLGPVGVVAGALTFGVDPAGREAPARADQQDAVHNVLLMALRKFGAHGIRSMAARNWMQQQLYNRSSGVERGVYGVGAVDQYNGLGGPAYHLRGGAGKLLDQVLGIHFGDSSTRSGKQPVDEFSDASKAMLQAARDLQMLARHGPGFASYNPSGLGVTGVQALGALAPGVEFASLIGGGSNGSAFTAFTGGAASSIPASLPLPGPGGGWQPCTLTWYDPALGGTNSGSGRPDPSSPTASGQPYSAGAMTCAAPSQYPFGTEIAFSYGGKSVTCTVNDRGGAISGSHFDLSRGAASALGMISAGRVNAKFKVTGSAGTGKGSAPSSSASGAWGGAGTGGAGSGAVMAAADTGATAVMAALRTAGGDTHKQPIHVHVHVDSREIRNHRVLLGHHH